MDVDQGADGDSGDDPIAPPPAAAGEEREERRPEHRGDEERVHPGEGGERKAERCDGEQERRQEADRLTGQLAREHRGEDERQEKEHERGQPKPFDSPRYGERHVLDEEVQRCAAAIEEHVGDDRGVRPRGVVDRDRLVEVQRLPPERRQRERRAPEHRECERCEEAGVQGSVRAMTPPSL